MSEKEDRRSALNIKMSLAANLITVALAFVGAEGGIAVFVLDKREHLAFFYVTGALASAMLTASVLCGGWGISAAYRNGYLGNWRLSDRGTFNWQAMFCVTGAALVLMTSILGTPKADTASFNPHTDVEAQIVELQNKVNDLSRRQDTLAKDLTTFTARRPVKVPRDSSDTK